MREAKDGDGGKEATTTTTGMDSKGGEDVLMS